MAVVAESTLPDDKAPATNGPLLDVVDLQTHFQTPVGTARSVDGVSFSVHAGQTVAVVGESGSGKTVTALSILRLIPMPPGRIVGGHIHFADRDLTTLSDAELTKVRGGQIAMIFQEPATSLNPIFTIGDQIADAVRLHVGGTEAEIRVIVLDALKQVRMSEPERRIDQYPHELSGGMKQRAMIAMALACRPRLLIADEPTTALDVTIQARILDLLRESQAAHDMAILLITHDLGVVAEVADEVVVMYAGKVVERGPVGPLFGQPLHPYTRGLFESLVRVDRRQKRLQTIEGQVPPATDFPAGCRFKARCPMAAEKCNEEPPLVEIEPGRFSACWFAEDLAKSQAAATPEVTDQATVAAIATPEAAKGPLLDVQDLSKWFPVRRGWFSRVREHVRAVDGVSFQIERGRTLGLVGESGCGKTTVGRALLRLVHAGSGRVLFDGQSVLDATGPEMHALRQRMQIVFQDPYGSLNPRMTVGAAVAEPLRNAGKLKGRKLHDRVAELLSEVGLGNDAVDRYPHEFSGGQRQRVGIARALALSPAFIVCDEPTSALDVSIRAQVINLLQDLQKKHGIAYLMISHDLGAVRQISHDVAVMYLGRIVERAPTEELYSNPRHPYTQALLEAIPVPDPQHARNRVAMLDDEAPSPIHIPTGCPYHPRCPLYQLKGKPDVCRTNVPLLQELKTAVKHEAACHFAEAEDLTKQA